MTARAAQLFRALQGSAVAATRARGLLAGIAPAGDPRGGDWGLGLSSHALGPHLLLVARALRETRAFLESAAGRSQLKQDRTAGGGGGGGSGGGSVASGGSGALVEGGSSAGAQLLLPDMSSVDVARAKALATLANSGELPMTFDVFSVRQKRCSF